MLYHRPWRPFHLASIPLLLKLSLSTPHHHSVFIAQMTYVFTPVGNPVLRCRRQRNKILKNRKCVLFSNILFAWHFEKIKSNEHKNAHSLKEAIEDEEENEEKPKKMDNGKTTWKSVR